MHNNEQFKKLWFVRIIELSKLSAISVATIILASILSLLYFTGMFAFDDSGRLIHIANIGDSLFISLWIPTTYFIVVIALRRSEQQLTKLRPYLPCSDKEFTSLLLNIYSSKKTSMLTWGIIGVLVGILTQFNGLKYIYENHEKVPASIYVMMVLGLCLWTLIFQVFSVLIRNAQNFGEIAKSYLEVNLVNINSTSPFSNVAIQPVLLAAGIYMLWPLKWIGSPINFSELTLPLLLTVPSLMFMLFLPLLPARRKIQQQKKTEIALLDDAINGNLSALKDSYIKRDMDRVTLPELIQFRQYIHSVNEWAIDAPALRQISLYIVLPPLTWIGAALVEQMVT
jgi:uncharacterized membrane protein